MATATFRVTQRPYLKIKKEKSDNEIQILMTFNNNSNKKKRNVSHVAINHIIGVVLTRIVFDNNDENALKQFFNIFFYDCLNSSFYFYYYRNNSFGI